MDWIVTLPDWLKLLVGAILVVAGVLGGWLLQDTLREPGQRNNIVLRRVGYFWIDRGNETYQIGAVAKVYNLGSRSTLLRGVSLEAAQPRISARGAMYLRRLALLAPTAETLSGTLLKDAGEQDFKLLLPIHMEAKIMNMPPSRVDYVGTWNLKLRFGSRNVQPEQSGTFDRLLTQQEWDNLDLQSTNGIPNQITYATVD